MTPTQFVSELSAIRFPNAFNPYSDACPVHDVPDAPAMRSAILTQILEAAEAASVDAIWVGRDLGFRGGRRTGIANHNTTVVGLYLAKNRIALNDCSFP